MDVTHQVKHTSHNGAFQSRAFFSVDGRAFEACRWTRPDGHTNGVEIYVLEANEPPTFLGYAEALYQLPAAEVALEILAR